MDSYEWNKIFGAILGSLLVVVGLGIITNDVLFYSSELEEDAFPIEIAEAENGEAPVEEVYDLGLLLANADAGAGERVARQCVSCHIFEQGGGNKTGPGLYGIVGREKGAVSDFAYSNALASAEGVWGYAELDGFLADPRGYLPGTSMSYAGLRRDSQRADVLAYLATLGEAPPFPDPLPAEAPEAEEAAEEIMEEAPSGLELEPSDAPETLTP